MENYKFNPVSKILTVTAAFEKAMNDPNSDEYKLFVQLQHDIPGLKVSRRTHKSPTKYRSKSGEVFRCNQYKNLTYENMENFISVLPKREELMEVYNYIRYGAGLVQTSCYTAVRRWFMAQFPNFRKNPLCYYNQDFTVLVAIEPIIKAAQNMGKQAESGNGTA